MSKGALMEFATQQDMALAMLTVAKWLPELVGRFEAGIRAQGLTILERRLERYDDGTSNPVLRVRVGRGRNGWTIELYLRNALDDFLTVDREEKPVRFDARLLDEKEAERKLDDIVTGRLAIARAMATSRTRDEFARKMERIAPSFEYVRFWQIEGSGGKG